MNALYYSIVTVGLACAGPILLLNSKARHGLGQKLGLTPVTRAAATTTPSDAPRLWFHAVSVGEFNAIFPLLQLIRRQHPNWQLFVSTTTGTGQKLAQEKVGDFAHVFYFPLDIPHAIKKSLDAIRPHVVAIAETEIWPGFTDECAKRGIQLCIVNGRISPRSFNRYMKLAFLFSPVIKRFNLLAVQSPTELSRYQALGAVPERISVCGNLKFDGIKTVSPEEKNELGARLGLPNGNDLPVVVAGSTHEGEEIALLQACSNAGTAFQLILVPRHPERFEQVAKLIEQQGFTVKRFSKNETIDGPKDVYLLDTIGLLAKVYAFADVAFVGGTLVKVGGHSLIEPYAYSVPVICGPHLFKTRDVAQSLIERNCLVVAEDQEMLQKKLDELLSDRSSRQSLGRNGSQFITESQGAVAKTLRLLEQLVNNEPAKDLSAICLEDNVIAGPSRTCK